MLPLFFACLYLKQETIKIINQEITYLSIWRDNWLFGIITTKKMSEFHKLDSTNILGHLKILA